MKSLIRSAAPAAADLPATIWYMGAKTRVLPRFLDEVLLEETPADASVLDVFSGTAVVSAFCARHFRVVANDVQRYAQVIAKAFIEHAPESRDAFLRSLNARRDLDAAAARHRSALEEVYAEALAQERRHLNDLDGAERPRPLALAEYRAFLELPGPFDEHGRNPAPIYRGAAELLAGPEMEACRRDPSRAPARLIVGHFGNVYFGLRQAIELDALRAAIGEIAAGRFAEARRTHYLAALLHAASVATSATAHFAQPRHLTKDSEVLAMARRRRIDIRALLEDYSGRIRATVAATAFRPGNRALCGPYEALLEETRLGPAFREDARCDLVYMDPPYTADHYSRFYHALETLCAYDYPPLERDAQGRVTRGRYPALAGRFQSRFCRRATVESEFERLLAAAANSGSRLVLSYATPSGLLLKTWKQADPRCDAVGRLEALARRRFSRVRTLRRALTHSGMGDKMSAIEELLVVCRP